ncbi:MAG: hypothetical protein JHC95_05090 [Solirubrobacteraceae bacterium]|nr:hypothetical protein [Solirubrobacteraceae bacterium]
MRRVLIAALIAALALPAVADSRAKSLKVTPAVGSAKTTFRVVFKPKYSATYANNLTYGVRMDWRGGRAKGCDKYAESIVNARRGRWSVGRLTPNTPRGDRRWCKGTWVGRVMRYEVDECSGDEICRDPDVYRTVERRWIRHVR